MARRLPRIICSSWRARASNRSLNEVSSLEAACTDPRSGARAERSGDRPPLDDARSPNATVRRRGSEPCHAPAPGRPTDLDARRRFGARASVALADRGAPARAAGLVAPCAVLPSTRTELCAVPARHRVRQRRRAAWRASRLVSRVVSARASARLDRKLVDLPRRAAGGCVPRRYTATAGGRHCGEPSVRPHPRRGRGRR